MATLPDDMKSAEGWRVVASSRTICIRYPTGESEFRLAAETPALGDTIKRDGERWRVIDVGTDEYQNPVVTLAPLDEGSPR